MEIELRAKVSKIQALKKKLESIGSLLDNENESIDEYYRIANVLKREFVLRLRMKNNKSILTLKKGAEGAWFEKEVIINDPRIMSEILLNTVFEKFLVIKKKRSTYKLNDFEINIDSIEGAGDYIEIELQNDDVEHSKMKIKELMKKLGIKENEITEKGYVKILLNED